MNNKKLFITGVLILFFGASAKLQNIAPPKPYGVLPQQRNLNILEMEMYCLMHLSPATYQNKEWGYGDADPSMFNPKKFDASQIVNAVKAGGFGGVTIVAKHHDGYCLFPTSSTDYNISKSEFRNGKGDLVKEMAAAVRKAGLQLGIYCSPWDRNNKYYADKKYVTDVFYTQLKELYTRYGPLFTVFFDGANGGDGYYGGTKEKRKIDASTYYDFDKIFKMVRRTQPTANIFSDVGPDLRWVGNEEGHAAKTCWASFTASGKNGKNPTPGNLDEANLGTGTRNGKIWCPAECDVPLRPGWFYHPEDDLKVRTPEKLLEIYYSSVGRGATLDLGISPNTDGLLSDGDVKKLSDFGKLIKATFSKNLAAGAIVEASNTRAKSPKFSPKFLLDNNRYSYWATDDDIKTPEAIFNLKSEIKFNVIRLRENIKLGQRIEDVAIDVWQNNNWSEIAAVTGIGANRLIRLPKYIYAKRLRLRVLKSPVCVALSDFGLFAEPEEIVANLSNVDKKISSKNSNWTAVGYEAIIDNNPKTIYTATAECPSSVIIDLSVMQNITGFEYLPRQDNIKDGLINKYKYFGSTDGVTWTELAKGEFSNITNNPITQTTRLEKPANVRFVKLVAEEIIAGKHATIAELNVISE